MSFPDNDHFEQSALPIRNNAAGPSRITIPSSSHSSPRTEMEPRASFDEYLENATPQEIRDVAKERELEAQAALGESPMGWGGEEEDATDAIFDGPASFSVPTSAIHHAAHRPSFSGRRSGSYGRSSSSFDPQRQRMIRTQSGESAQNMNDAASAVSAYSVEGHMPRPRQNRNHSSRAYSRRSSRSEMPDMEGVEGGEYEDEEMEEERVRERSHEVPPSPGLFPRIASALFGKSSARDEDVDEEGGGGGLGRERSRSVGSRGGMSRRGSSEDLSEVEEEENWGYSSGEDTDNYSETSRRDGESYSSSIADDTSLPPQSRPSSPPMPLLPSDMIFGDPNSQSTNPQFLPHTFKNESSSSRQTILLPDEDLSIRFTGYVTHRINSTFWLIGCVLSFGILGLVGRWIPKLYIKWYGRELSFEKSGPGAWIVVETPYGDLHTINQKTLDYPYPLSTVFPQTASLAMSTAKNSAIPSAESSRAPSIVAANAKLHAPPSGSDVASNGTVTGNVGGAKDLTTVDLERGSVTFEETMGHLKMAEYRYTRFVLQPGSWQWTMVRDWRDPRWTSARAVINGLAESTREQRRILFGENVIDIAGKSIVGLLLDEVLHPFYVFQIASIVLWSLDDYYYYAFAIALISATSILSSLVETKRTIERMREMSRFTCNVNAYVDGEWRIVDSGSLVPGDLFEASDPTLATFPCDAILLSGDAIVNESMLTGESVPVSKIPAKDDAIRSMSKEDKKGSSEVSAEMAKHYLFAGTKIIRVRPGGFIAGTGTPGKAHAGKALAMVTRTGFNTTKGALVRSMLFPKPMGFKFYRDSMNFIGVLAMIAGVGFAISAVQFIRIGITWQTILVRALDLITIVVPPALPATLTIGTTFAIERLRKLGIFCISPNRVNIGGKVNVICFDKTGTLTEDGLDVLGVRTIDRYTERFSELHGEIRDVPDAGGKGGKTPLLYALATCHQLKMIDGEVIGDPLDIKMFEFTGWTLDEGRGPPEPGPEQDGAKPQRVVERPHTLVQTVVRPPGSERWKLEDALKGSGKHAHFLELGVIRTFDFVSALRRMSVIVKRLKSHSMEVYVKGAPEVMSEVCDPETFPKDYEDMLSYYTRNGFRVIAIAGKSIDSLTWLKAQRMKREQAESGLHFLGFIVFENKLKPETAGAIHSLRSAHLACRMVTGDNVRTAISVARECGLVSHSASVFIPTFLSGEGTPDAEIDWSSVDDEKHKLDPYNLKPIAPPNSYGYDSTELQQSDYQLALTGDVFRWMLDFAPLETMQRMLVKGVIFARMAPDEKAELVERLQGLGYTVGFCGDGANDCGALKAADIGISLSEAEASVAAPFTSRVTDISCVIEVIKEGRAALVTSFSCFKYMALYSLIQFTTVTLLYSFASSLGDFQFLYIDLFIIIPIAVAMGRTLPYGRIVPKRPTASLVSKKVLTSIIGQTLINSVIQLVVFFWIRAQPWYTEPPINDEKLDTFNYENTALFLISSFQYILVAAVFSVGPPYRKPMYSNPSLMICLTVLTGFSLYVLLAPSQSIALILDLMSVTMRFRLELLAIVFANIVLCFSFERYAERPIARAIGHFKKWMHGRKASKNRRRITSGKMYKTIEGSMR